MSRHLKKTSAFALATLGLWCAWGSDAAEPCIRYDADLRDRCWMYGHEPGQFDHPNGFFRIPMSPKVTQAEACAYLDIPNLCIDPGFLPDDAWCEQLKGLKRVSWVVDNGCLQMEGRDILPKFLSYAESQLAKHPNICAVVFDDFFYQPQQPLRRERRADGVEVDVLPGSRTLAELARYRDRIHALGRPVEIELVYYERDLAFAEATRPVTDLFDAITFWTWYGKNVADLERNFETYRTIAPGKPTILGIYMWDFGDCKPLTEEFMKVQLDFALKLFREGRCDGFIFHCTPLVNKNFKVVEMCREWIRVHGNEKFGGGVQSVPPRPRTRDFGPDKAAADLGHVAFPRGTPESSFFASDGRVIAHVERSGRIAWKKSVAGRVGKVLYKSGCVYYSADGVLWRVPYVLPCDANRKPERIAAPVAAFAPSAAGGICFADATTREVVECDLDGTNAKALFRLETLPAALACGADGTFHLAFGGTAVRCARTGKVLKKTPVGIGALTDICCPTEGNVLYASRDAVSERGTDGTEVWRLDRGDVPFATAFASCQLIRHRMNDGETEDDKVFVGGDRPFEVNRQKKILWDGGSGLGSTWKLPR